MIKRSFKALLNDTRLFLLGPRVFHSQLRRIRSIRVLRAEHVLRQTRWQSPQSSLCEERERNLILPMDSLSSALQSLSILYSTPVVEHLRLEERGALIRPGWIVIRLQNAHHRCHSPANMSELRGRHDWSVLQRSSPASGEKKTAKSLGPYHSGGLVSDRKVPGQLSGGPLHDHETDVHWHLVISNILIE